jgi:hypothetical protein
VRSIRKAPFALRVVERRDGKAGIVYRRRPDAQGRDRLQRVASLSPLGFLAGAGLVRDAVCLSQITKPKGKTKVANFDVRALPAGHYFPLDPDWGARLACYGIISAGLRDAERLGLSASHLRRADAGEAAWWLGMLTSNGSLRAVRALRILTEAVV